MARYARFEGKVWSATPPYRRMGADPTEWVTLQSPDWENGNPRAVEAAAVEFLEGYAPPALAGPAVDEADGVDGDEASDEAGENAGSTDSPEGDSADGSEDNGAAVEPPSAPERPRGRREGRANR